MAGEGHIGEEGSERGFLCLLGAIVVLRERRIGDALGTERCGSVGGEEKREVGGLERGEITD